MELRIEKLIAGGRGLARHEGRVHFVPNVLPGELVRVRVKNALGKAVACELLEVLEPSIERARPRCPVFAECGGCQWQHVNYAEQLRCKREIVREQLIRIGGVVDPLVHDVMPSPQQWNYRSRIQLQIDDAQRVGFYRAGSHEVVEFEECLIADERINTQLPQAKQRLRTEGNGRHVRVDDGHGFTQVNTAQNEQLQQHLVDGVRARLREHVVELHCGNGNLSFPLASVSQRVTAADDHAGSIEQAKVRAEQETSMHVDFRCTAAHKLLRELRSDNASVDGIVLDPPRRGAAELVDAVLDLAPQWIAYVSCDPSTLSRDLKALCAEQYQLESCQPIDMFPQTHHIECVAWLSRVESS